MNFLLNSIAHRTPSLYVAIVSPLLFWLFTGDTLLPSPSFTHLADAFPHRHASPFLYNTFYNLFLLGKSSFSLEDSFFLLSRCILSHYLPHYLLFHVHLHFLFVRFYLETYLGPLTLATHVHYYDLSQDTYLCIHSTQKVFARCYHHHHSSSSENIASDEDAVVFPCSPSGPLCTVCRRRKSGLALN
jgi:hypothetical protein